LCAIPTHDPSVRAGEGISGLRATGHYVCGLPKIFSETDIKAHIFHFMTGKFIL
jgi:hypothetical protein